MKGTQTEAVRSWLFQ